MQTRVPLLHLGYKVLERESEEQRKSCVSLLLAPTAKKRGYSPVIVPNSPYQRNAMLRRRDRRTRTDVPNALYIEKQYIQRTAEKVHAGL